MSNYDLYKFLGEEYAEYYSTLVIANGCFDLLHVGHFNVIKEVLSISRMHSKIYKGSAPIIFLNSDEYIVKNKRQPIFCYEERVNNLTDLGVDYIEKFEKEEELEEFIKSFKNYHPDNKIIMVKGSDYEGKPYTGMQYVNEVSWVRHNGLSTSKIIERIKNI